MRKVYIVWNNDRTEGFVTADEQMAYEARKGAISNCYSSEGIKSELATRFCEVYSEEEDCTIEEINV